MLPILIGLLISISIYLLFYQLKLVQHQSQKAHLPTSVLKNNFGDMDLPLKTDNISTKFKKAWLPFTNRFKVYDSKIKAHSIRRKLINAGSPMGLLEFLAFKVLAMVLVPVVAFVFLQSTFPPLLLLIGGLAIGYLLPDFWLSNKIAKRQLRIRRDLPNIIDLLNLCVSGGLDFMLAVNRVIKDLPPCDLTKELAEVYRETQMGKTRREALKNFAWRVDCPEVYSFVRTLIQAERMGTPISETLKVQAEDLRVRRFHRGETLALKAPIKLLFPLFAFILPSVLIIVAGPIFLQFTRTKIGF